MREIMEIEQKANKVIRPTSIYTLSAEETNQITTELQNVITAGGLTPSNSTLTQLLDAINNLISQSSQNIPYATSSTVGGVRISVDANNVVTIYTGD